MLCVQELCSIFKNLHPHKRIELMCGLLQCCFPLELRFIGSYVENLGRRDFHYLREYEIKSNSCAEISKLFKANEDVIRHKLAVYLSLLHTSNSVCSKLCFDLLMSLNTYLIRAYASPLTYTKLTLDVMLELLTVLVMGINHPAFTFEQRSRLFEIYRLLESRAECLLPVSMDNQFQATEAPPDDPRSVDVELKQSIPNPVEENALLTKNIPPESVPSPVYNKIVTPGKTDREPDLHIGDVPIFLEPVGNPFFHCPEDPLLTSPLGESLQSPLQPAPSTVFAPGSSSHNPQSWPRPKLGTSPSQAEHRLFFQDSSQKVFIKRVQVTGSRKTERKQEFQMEVTWSNGETSEVYKSYQELYDFHARLVQFYPEDASVHRQDRKLPFLSGNPHLSSREDVVVQTSNTITNYFRKLVSLDNDILGCDIVLDFLHETGSINPASSMSPSSRQSSLTSPCYPQQDVGFTSENCSSNSIIITRASPLRDVTHSSSDYSPEKSSLVRRSPSTNHRQTLPVTQQLLDPRKDSRSPSPKNTEASNPLQDNQSPSPKHLVQEQLKPLQGNQSFSPKHNESLPTIEELLDELQLLHHKDTFNQFTMTQLMNFQEQDFLMLKLSSHAEKRLKIKLKQLGRGKLNGFRSMPSFDLTQPQLPPDTLYTSTASLGQLTSSDNGNSSRDSSPPVSPRQLKTMHSRSLQATGTSSLDDLPIPQVTGPVSPHHSSIPNVSGPALPCHSRVSSGPSSPNSAIPHLTGQVSSHHSSISNVSGPALPCHSPVFDVTGPCSPHHSPISHSTGQVSSRHSSIPNVSRPALPCHSNLSHVSGPTSPHHPVISHSSGHNDRCHSPIPNFTESSHQVNSAQMTTCYIQGTEPLSPLSLQTQHLGNQESKAPISQMQDKIKQISNFPCTDHISPHPVNVVNTSLCGLPYKSESTEDSTDLQFQSSHVYPTGERMEQPRSERAPLPNKEVQPTTERLQPLEDHIERLDVQEGCPHLMSNHFQGPIQEPIRAVPLSGPTLEPVTVQVDCVLPDLMPNQTSQNEEPCDRPQNNKPIEFPSHIYHPGFMPDPAAAYHVPRPNYPRMYPQMYPICAPQPAHLPRHMYNNLPVCGEHLIHSKKPIGKPYLQTHTDPITNKVMTVTVNSAAYRPPFTDCPPSSSPITPVTSPANLARSMSIVSPHGASPRFAFPSTIASPITYSNVNPTHIHHMKPVNSQPSNRDSPPTSRENGNFGASQHVNTTVGGAPQYSSPAPVVNFHSSCTSCGCRGRCGGNYSAAYGGYGHHQISMPPVLHLPAFMSSNSNGLLPSPCLPPNCQLPFAMNPLPNGITPEQISLHSYLSQASNHAPTALNRMFYHTHNNAARERDPKAKPPMCYNCGRSGHEATDCKEATMESSSGQYCLNFKPDYLD